MFTEHLLCTKCRDYNSEQNNICSRGALHEKRKLEVHILRQPPTLLRSVHPSFPWQIFNLVFVLIFQKRILDYLQQLNPTVSSRAILQTSYHSGVCDINFCFKWFHSRQKDSKPEKNRLRFFGFFLIYFCFFHYSIFVP